jgi:hypothetical protein
MSIEAMKAIQMVYANTTKHDWPDDIWDAICQAIEAEKQAPDDLTIAYMSGFHDGKKKREWVELTDEEIEQGCKESWVTLQAWQSAVWWAEAKLKEKNT